MAADAPRVSQPIILIGAPRSGTTLLADLLEAHPDVVVAREPRLVWRYGNDGRSDELRPSHATPEVVDHIHERFGAMLQTGGGTRLVEKTPANSVRPRFVDAVFPDARYVHITRNGWGAVPSMRSFWERRGDGLDKRQVAKIGRRLRESRPSQLRFYLPELARRAIGGGRRTSLYGPRLAGLQQMADELGHLEAAARQWRSCIDQTASFGRSLPADRYMELRLEALDEHAITNVLEFCGLPPSPEVLQQFQDGYDPAAAQRQTPLTEEEQGIVAPFVTAANAWLGYDPTPPAGTAGPP